MESSCPLIKNILILDSEGKRIAVKYYGNDWCEPAHPVTDFPRLRVWGLALDPLAGGHTHESPAG
jgi:hypothetical protein